jgi:hypothetical protein
MLPMSGSGLPTEMNDAGGLGGAGPGAYAIAFILTALCMPIILGLSLGLLALVGPWGLHAGMTLPNFLGGVAGLVFVGLALLPFWAGLALACSFASLPLTAWAVRRARQHPQVRPIVDIAYGAGLGAIWGVLLGLLPYFTWTITPVILVSSTTGAVWGFWFWRFDRKARAT